MRSRLRQEYKKLPKNIKNNENFKQRILAGDTKLNLTKTFIKKKHTISKLEERKKNTFRSRKEKNS